MFRSKILIVALLILTVLTIFIFQKREAIFQEGNPIPFAIAASKMILQDKEVVKIERQDEYSGESNLYLVKQGEMDPFIKMMEMNGWDFTNRDIIQNRLDFERENQSIGLGYRYYTKYYTIIESPKIY